MNIGDLVMDLVVNTGNLNAQMGSIKNVIMGTLGGVLTGVIGGQIDKLATDADRANKQFAVWEKTLARFKVSNDEASSTVQFLTEKFGVLPSVVQDAATTFLRGGGTMNEFKMAMLAAGASSAAAGTDIANSMKNVSTALITGRSELVESAGLITNFGPEYQKFAKSIGKTVEQLTDQERIQAGLNAILKESQYEIADVDTLMEGLAGTNAKLNTAQTNLSKVIGDLFVPVVNQAKGEATGVIEQLVGWANTNKNVLYPSIQAGYDIISGLGMLVAGVVGKVVMGITSLFAVVGQVIGRASVAVQESFHQMAVSVDKLLKGDIKGAGEAAAGIKDAFMQPFNGLGADISAIYEKSFSGLNQLSKDAEGRLTKGFTTAFKLANGEIPKTEAAVLKVSKSTIDLSKYLNDSASASGKDSDAKKKLREALSAAKDELTILTRKYDLQIITESQYRTGLDRLIGKYTQLMNAQKEGTDQWDTYSAIVKGARDVLDDLNSSLAATRERLSELQKGDARKNFVDGLGLEEVERRLALIPAQLKKATSPEQLDDVLSLKQVLENRKNELEQYFSDVDRMLAEFYEDFSKNADKYHDMGLGSRTASTPTKVFGIDIEMIEGMVARAKGSVDDLTNVIDTLTFAMDTGQVDAQDYAQGIQWAQDAIVDLTESVDEFLAGAPLVEDHFDHVVQTGPSLQKTLEDLARSYENLAKAQEVVFGRQTDAQFKEWQANLRSGTVEQLQGYRQMLESEFNAVSTTPDSTGFIDLQLQSRLKAQLDALDSVILDKQKDLAAKSLEAWEDGIQASQVMNVSFMAPKMDLSQIDQARQLLEEVISKGFGKTEQGADLLARALDKLDQRFADLTTNWDELIAQADHTPESLQRVAQDLDKLNQQSADGLASLLKRDLPTADMDRIAEIRTQVESLANTDFGKSAIGVQALAEAYQALDDAAADLSVDFDLIAETAQEVPDHFTRIGQAVIDLNQQFSAGVASMVLEGIQGADLEGLEGLRKKILSLGETTEGKSDLGSQAIAEGLQLIDEAIADLTTDWEALAQTGEDVIDRWNRTPDLVEKLNQRSADALAALISSSLPGATLEGLGELRSTVESLAETDFGKSQTGMQAIAEAVQAIDEAVADLTTDWVGLEQAGEDVIDHWNRTGETAEQVSARWQASLDSLYAKIDQGTEETLPGIKQGIQEAFNTGQIDQQQFDLLTDALLAKFAEFQSDMEFGGAALAESLNENLDDIGFRGLSKGMTQAEKDSMALVGALKLLTDSQEYLKGMTTTATPQWELYARALDAAAKNVDDPLSTNLKELAANLRQVGKDSEAFELLKQRIDQTIDVLSRFGRQNTDFGANMAGLGNLLNTGLGIFQKLAKGDIFGAIVQGIGSIIDAFTGFQKAAENARKANEDFQAQFSFVDGSKFGGAYTRSRGFLADLFGGGPEVVQWSDELAVSVAKSLESGVKSGLGSGIKAFLEGTGDILTGLKDGIKGAIIGAITEAVIQGAIVKGALGQLLTDLTSAIAAGDMGGAAGIVSQLTSALPALAANLETLLQPLQGVLGSSDLGGTSATSTSMGSLPIASQFAVATPLVEASNRFMDGANLIWEAAQMFAQGATIRIQMPDGSTDTLALRGI